jgi:hypothetical protein
VISGPTLIKDLCRWSEITVTCKWSLLLMLDLSLISDLFYCRWSVSVIPGCRSLISSLFHCHLISDLCHWLVVAVANLWSLYLSPLFNGLCRWLVIPVPEQWSLSVISGLCHGSTFPVPDKRSLLLISDFCHWSGISIPHQWSLSLSVINGHGHWWSDIDTDQWFVTD